MTQQNLTPVVAEMRGDRFHLWSRVRLPLAATLAGADVLHCPANTGPPYSLVPMLLTIHDLIPLQPKFASRKSRRWGKVVAKTARKARVVTTPSEYSKSEIVQTFGIDEEKVIVAPWAASPNCLPVQDRILRNAIRRKYGLNEDQPYVLAFGGWDPRKNTRSILQAWKRLTAGQRNGAALIVIGIQEPLLSELRHTIASEGLTDSCHLYGYALEQHLPTLLSAAEFLCFPSLSEGFGLPVLDAFACRTAVLTSAVTSIPEVAGEAAYYVDPNSVESIARGMASLLRDGSMRDEMAALGFERAKNFSWDKCAETYCQVFERFQ